MEEIVKFEVRENIGYIILNSPPANSMTKNFFNKFYKIVKEVKRKEGSTLKGIIITGVGRHFSSGANLDELFEIVGNEIKNRFLIKKSSFLTKNNKTFLILDKLKIPLLAAIKGVCLGSAFELALFCHARIAAANSVLGFPETQFNIIPGLGGNYKISHLLKFSKALELILRAETFSVEEALKLNLVDKIVRKEELLELSHSIVKFLSGIKNYNKNNIKIYLSHYFKKSRILDGKI